MLEKFYLDKANPVNTSMKKSILLSQHKEKEASPSEKKRYQGMTRSIIFSIVETRPNIASATFLISQFTKNLSHLHTEIVKTIFKYLQGSKHQGITYREDEKLKIKSHLDFD